MRICPRCKRPYAGIPALSRKDNKTEICPGCGTKEALVDFYSHSDGFVEKLRRELPEGTRVRLIRMDDIQAPPVGTLGTARGVDDIGSIMVSWDNGSSLSVVFGEDEIEVLKDEK